MVATTESTALAAWADVIPDFFSASTRVRLLTTLFLFVPWRHVPQDATPLRPTVAFPGSEADP